MKGCEFMNISPKTIRGINKVTVPFRAIYATIVSSILEVLSLGVASPYIKLFWKYAYDFLKIEEPTEHVI